MAAGVLADSNRRTDPLVRVFGGFGDSGGDAVERDPAAELPSLGQAVRRRRVSRR